MYSRPVEQDVHRRHRFRERGIVDRCHGQVFDFAYRVGDATRLYAWLEREPSWLYIQTGRSGEFLDGETEEEYLSTARGDDVDCLSGISHRQDMVRPLQQGIELDRYERFPQDSVAEGSVLQYGSHIYSFRSRREPICYWLM